MKISNDDYKDLATPEMLGLGTYLSGQFVKDKVINNGFVVQNNFDEQKSFEDLELEKY
ncbi:MAG: hypothetical protein PHC46_03535 [Clostridia bacterium]|nr:hypothetical protein [Clostridia bacterium]